MLGIEKGNTVENSFWKRLFTCRKADYGLRDSLQLWPRSAGWRTMIYALFCCEREQKVASDHFKVTVIIIHCDTAVADDNIALSSTVCIACYQAPSETDPYILTSEKHTHTNTYKAMRRITPLRLTTDNI